MNQHNARLVLTIVGIWWSFVVFLVFLQAGFMSRYVVFYVIALFALYYTYKFSQKWLGQILEGRTFARKALFFFIALHFLPLLLQFLTIRHPSWDNLLLAALGLVLFEFN